MAKMFYSVDETKAALGKTEEELKQLSREGKLREFRDGAKLMYKADQVEQLKTEGTPTEGISLGASDTGAGFSLSDSRTSTGSSISLADTGKEDTSLSSDLGISGSGAGVPSPRGTRAGSGINVFNPGEIDPADSSARTAAGASARDNIPLEGAGSGSGLLDLTRESDDTSLGSELLSEIQSSGKPEAPSAPALVAGGAGIAPPSRMTAPVVVEKPDPTAPAFGGMALGATLFVLLGVFVLLSGAQGAVPSFTDQLADLGFAILAAAGLGVAVVFAAIGFVLGKVIR
jgi:hypothetical protein